MSTLLTAILPVLLHAAASPPQRDPYEAYLKARIEIAQANLLNLETVLDEAGRPNPYCRRTVEWNPGSKTYRVIFDPSPFNRRYDPAHPCADASGFVLYPNVDRITEELEIRVAKEELARVAAR
jgi:flagellar basal body rod protein FlgC